MKNQAEKEIEFIDNYIAELTQQKPLLFIIDFYHKIKLLMDITQTKELYLSISREKSDHKWTYNGLYLRYGPENDPDEDKYKAWYEFEKFNISMPNGWGCVHELCTIIEWPETVMKYDMPLDDFLHNFFGKDFSLMHLNKKINHELEEKQIIQSKKMKV